MNSQAIPVIDRTPKKLLMYVVAIPFYLILVPLNWLLKISGKPAALMRTIGKKQFSPKRNSKVFADYIPDEGDIFVSTFSKSGTNWMMQIAHQIAWQGEGEFENIHDVVCWPDVPGKRSERVSTPLRSDLLKTLSPTGMRVIKTHLASQYVPYSEKAKYLIVVRDPKEVFVSSYPFVKGVAGPLMPSVDVWLKLFFTQEWPMNFGNTWAQHTAGYWAMKDRPNVLVLSYSKLKHDPETGIREVAKTLEVDLSEEQLAKVVEKSSFNYMKKINRKFAPSDTSSLPWAKGFTMIREGKTGNSSELISPEQQRLIDEHFMQELKDLHSDFPYDDFFQTGTVAD